MGIAYLKQELEENDIVMDAVQNIYNETGEIAEEALWELENQIIEDIQNKEKLKNNKQYYLNIVMNYATERITSVLKENYSKVVNNMVKHAEIWKKENEM